MKAKVIKLSKEEGLEAIFEVNEKIIEAMDCAGYGQEKVNIGETVNIRLVAALSDEDETIDEILRGNPDKLKKLETINGWRYRAYGEIISLALSVIDCGEVVIESDFDEGVIGDFVAFNIKWLDACLSEG